MAFLTFLNEPFSVPVPTALPPIAATALVSIPGLNTSSTSSLNETFSLAMEQVKSIDVDKMFAVLPSSVNQLLANTTASPELQDCEQQSGSNMILMLETIVKEIDSALDGIQYILYGLSYGTLDIISFLTMLEQEMQKAITAMSQIFYYVSGINMYCVAYSQQAGDIKKMVYNVISNNSLLYEMAQSAFEGPGLSIVDPRTVVLTFLNKLEQALNMLMDTLSAEYLDSNPDDPDTAGGQDQPGAQDNSPQGGDSSSGTNGGGFSGFTGNYVAGPKGDAKHPGAVMADAVSRNHAMPHDRLGMYRPDPSAPFAFFVASKLV